MNRSDIGKLHVTFEYPNRVASQKVMTEVFNLRGVGSYHYMPSLGGPRITVIAEDIPRGHDAIASARKVLSAHGGREATIDEELLEGLRERRWKKALLAAAGELPTRTKGHHPQGAILTPDGRVIDLGSPS